MSLAPLVTMFTTLLGQGLLLVPAVAGLGLMIGGGTMALGNHSRGKEAIMAALVGAAVMVSSVAIASTIHA